MPRQAKQRYPRRDQPRAFPDANSQADAVQQADGRIRPAVTWRAVMVWLFPAILFLWFAWRAVRAWGKFRQALKTRAAMSAEERLADLEE